MKTMVGEPSRRAPDLDFALGGLDFQGDTGPARLLGDVPFNVFARAISAARVNLNMTRARTPTVAGSSTARPFELASSGAAIVSNPHEGIERWFEPGASWSSSRARRRPSPRTASSSPTLARPRRWAARARERVLDEHTYAHRARRLLELIGLEAGVPRERRRSSPSSRRGTRRARSGVVDEIRAFDPDIQIVVVDDASGDDTAAVASAHGATVLRLPFNVGIGGAVQTGFRYALDEGYERRRSPGRRRPARRVAAREAPRPDPTPATRTS